jgi:ABC-2 type transport system permease protein
VATAPASRGTIIRAKIEAVLTVIACVAVPFVLGIAFISKTGAVVTLCGIVAASVSAITIQLWFKSTAKRSQFRRRQTATKVATFSEAFCSVFWAGATGVAAASSWFALAFVALALLTLWLTSRIKPEN